MTNQRKAQELAQGFPQLTGQTIKTAKVLGVNCVLLELENGKIYSIETVYVGTGLSGMEMIEVPREELEENFGISLDK